MPPPLITVVTVCRNPGPRLRDALASVWSQRGTDCEAVVVDGGSTDGTAAWLEAQRAQLGALLGGPDAGVYDAMNQGVAVARGDWVLFLSADDRLAGDEILARAAPMLRTTAAGVVAGEALFDDGRVYRFTGPAGAVRRNFIHHQAAFYRRTLLTANPFDTGLQVMADYDLNLRLLRRGADFATLPFRVAVCGRGGLSDSGAWRGYREEITVRHRHFPTWHCWLWDLGSVVRCGRKKIVRGFRSHG